MRFICSPVTKAYGRKARREDGENFQTLPHPWKDLPGPCQIFTVSVEKILLAS